MPPATMGHSGRRWLVSLHSSDTHVKRAVWPLDDDARRDTPAARRATNARRMAAHTANVNNASARRSRASTTGGPREAEVQLTKDHPTTELVGQSLSPHALGGRRHVCVARDRRQRLPWLFLPRPANHPALPGNPTPSAVDARHGRRGGRHWPFDCANTASSNAHAI
ncbi:hypothetical protein P154DRAFT_117432 [Amniculicola lignicola CBS 123094]|uniref:Uncharacterized protein n=1 Tax=Amniculicola lignicola CBS 123094 TaxID=1392246 RepID=A0A6A5X328_9PLEO|nr:hypothetical protein P154DRAFT_117432 [Amniculicola lignicola CBS 123094]